MAIVFTTLEARLAHDTGLVANLARAALPDDIAEREGARAHALRRLSAEALDRSRRAIGEVDFGYSLG